MPGLNLSNGVAVSRTGATTDWTGLAGSPAYTSATYSPGSKSKYARFKVLPASSLTTLPSTLYLFISASFAPSDLGTVVIDDTVALGNSSGPTTTNQAYLAPATGTNNYLLSTSGFTVADLNAGNVYLWLGYRADPTTYTGYGASISPTSPQTTQTLGTAVQHTDWTVTVTGPGAYAVVQITSAVSSTGTSESGHPLGYTGTATADSGLGNTDSGSIAAPATEDMASGRFASTTVSRRVPLYSGTETTTVLDAHGTSSVTGAYQDGSVVSTLYASVVTPSPATLTLSSLGLSYATGGSGGDLGGSAVLGAILAQDEQEMTTLYLGDTLTFWAQLSRYSTGEAYDATGSVAYRIYEETTDTPVLTGSMPVQDDPNTLGFYRAQALISSGNGFEVGKSYCVRVAVTVDSVAQSGVVERFVVRDPVLSAAAVASGVWAAVDPGDAAGRASSLGGMVRQIWSYCFNRNAIQGSLQTVYRDDSSTVMLHGAQSASDTAADRGRMS